MKKDKNELKQQKKQEKLKRKTNTEMAIVTYIFLVLFVVMIGYLATFTFQNKDKLLNNQYNKRQELLAQHITRGEILSAEGKVLAKTVKGSNGNETRTYPYDGLFSHVVGRFENGKTGLELSNSFTLLTTGINPVYAMLNQMKGEKNPGNNIVTTLNVSLSKVASNALGSRKGAVVVLDPTNGKILAMVSKPTYNPNKVTENWSSLLKDEGDDSALYNRATQGLYPPGSTFKLYTTLEYMRENTNYKKFSYRCKGTVTNGSDSVHCFNGEVHGNLDLSGALAHSCNSAYCQIAQGLNIGSWRSLCESLYFNKSIPVDLEQKTSAFKLKDGAAQGTVWQTGIGQGQTLVSPLQNALLVAAVENGGDLMKPYVVDRVEDAYQNVVSKTEPESLGTPVSKSEAKALRKMMIGVVKSGTARSLGYGGYTAGGKTGSAEYQLTGSASHAWFVGFAEKNGKKLVVSVIVEGAGTGGTYAVPIARQIFNAYWS